MTNHVDEIVVTGTQHSYGGSGLTFFSFGGGGGFGTPQAPPQEILEPGEGSRGFFERINDFLRNLKNTSWTEDTAVRENRYANNGKGWDATETKAIIDDDTALMNDGSYWHDVDGNGVYDTHYTFVEDWRTGGTSVYWDADADGAVDEIF